MSVFVGHHLIVIMTLQWIYRLKPPVARRAMNTLGGSAPTAKASLVAIVANYLYTTVQIFSVPVIKETSQCAPAPNRGMAGDRGLSSRWKEVILWNPISSGSDDGCGNFYIPSFAMDAAAPKGVPRRPQLPDFLETVLAPPCPARIPEAGSAHV